MSKQRRIGLQVKQVTNEKLERLPDTYLVLVVRNDGEEDSKLEESIEFGSFQEALQAFINRL